MKGIVEYKDYAGSVKDIDVKKRIVTGMLAHFGDVDFSDDITHKGAFQRSINSRGPKGDNSIYFLNFHNFDQPHNTFNVLEEQKDGLYFEAELPNTSYSNDTLELYDKGILKQHSYGHIVQKKSFTTTGSKKIRNIEETYLLEGSNVTLGMNSNTPFLGFKSKDIKEQEDLIGKIMSVLRHGNLTDASFKQLEIGLKQLQRDAFELGKNSLIGENPDNTTSQSNPNIFNGLINVLSN